MNDKDYYYPITHPQQRILYTEKFHQNTSIGNIVSTVTVKGEIDYQLFNQAINIMIQKNEGLRLRIFEKDGQVRQYISEYKHVNVDFLDFSYYKLKDIKEWETKQAQTPFVLEESDLYYFALVKISDKQAYLFMKVHHIITDAWSMVMLANKILGHYNGLINGIELNSNYPSYIEYIESEKLYKESKRFIKDKDFWVKKFDNIPDPASLRIRDNGNISSKANRATFTIPEGFASQIRKYCLENKTSIFSIFLSVLAIYINRVTDNEDIVLGTPVLNRSNYMEKETIGMFVSTVPLRIHVKDNINYQNFINSITSEWMSMLRHQRYPYDLLLKDLRKKHKKVDHLYDILLSYQNGKLNKNIETDFEGRWHASGYQADSLFVHINDRDGDGSFVIDYDYKTQFFNYKDMKNINKCLINILKDAINNPEKLISQLELTDEEEKKCILSIFNNTEKEYQENKTAQELFELQTIKTPDQIAVVF